MGRSSCFCRSIFATNVEIVDFTFILSQLSSLVIIWVLGATLLDVIGARTER